MRHFLIAMTFLAALPGGVQAEEVMWRLSGTTTITQKSGETQRQEIVHTFQGERLRQENTSDHQVMIFDIPGKWAAIVNERERSHVLMTGEKFDQMLGSLQGPYVDGAALRSGKRQVHEKLFTKTGKKTSIAGERCFEVTKSLITSVAPGINLSNTAWLSPGWLEVDLARSRTLGFPPELLAALQKQIKGVGGGEVRTVSEVMGIRVETTFTRKEKVSPPDPAAFEIPKDSLKRDIDLALPRLPSIPTR